MRILPESRSDRDQSRLSSSRWAWLAVGALTVWALVLRWPGVTAWWFNPDEAMYFEIATASYGSVAPMIRYHVHPPLYFWILWLLALIDDSAPVLRLPALVAGVALVPVMFLAVRRYAGTLAGVIASLLACLSPGAIMMSQVVRPYALQVLCLTIALYGLLSYFQDGRRSRLVLYVLAAGSALFLHYSSFIALSGIGLCLAVLFARRRLDRVRLQELALAHALLLAVGVYLYASFIHGMQGGEMQVQARDRLFHKEFIFGLADIPRTLLGATRFTLGGSHFGLAGSAFLSVRFHLLSLNFTAFTACAVALMLFGLARSLRGQAAGTFLFPIGVLATGVGMSALGQCPLGNSRHSTYLLVVFMPLLASGLAGLIQSPRTLARVLGMACLAVAAAVLNLQAFAGGLAANPPGILPEQQTSRSDAAEVRQFLLEELGDDALLVTDWQTFKLLGVLLDSYTEEVSVLEGTDLATMSAGGRLFLFGMPGMDEPWRTWSLQWRRRGLDKGTHLSQVLDALEVESAEGRYAGDRELWFVQGGWAPNPAVGERARTRNKVEFVTRTVGGEGLGAFRIDRDGYRAYLAGP